MADMQVRRSAQRPATESDGIVSRHSFSFGPYYDPGNLGFGALLACNEDVIAPGAGYPPHPHRETEIVTWVLSGILRHRDDHGGQGIVEAGMVQRLSAGSGVEHSELSIAEAGELHLVQMWVRPDEVGGPPDYAVVDVSSSLSGGQLTPIVSGLPQHRGVAPLTLRQAGAGLSAARLGAGMGIALPAAALAHLLVTAGSVEIEADGVAESIGPGDAVRIIGADGEAVRAAGDAEILVWELAEQ